MKYVIRYRMFKFQHELDHTKFILAFAETSLLRIKFQVVTIVSSCFHDFVLFLDDVLALIYRQSAQLWWCV